MRTTIYRSLQELQPFSCCSCRLDETLLGQVLHDGFHLPIKSARKIYEGDYEAYVCCCHANLHVPPLGVRSTGVLVRLLYITKATRFTLSIVFFSSCIEPDELIDLID
jgi:hypothetical protein